MLDAMLGQVEAREQSCPTGRAHCRVAKGAGEGQPVVGEAFSVGQVCIRPAFRPILRRTLLVGDDENNVWTDTWADRAASPSLGEVRGERRAGRNCTAGSSSYELTTRETRR